MMLKPTVVMARVVGIGVRINTQARQRNKRERYQKRQTNCAYSQTDSFHLPTPGPHRTRGLLPSHWVKCPAGRARRTATPDPRLGRMYRAANSELSGGACEFDRAPLPCLELTEIPNTGAFQFTRG